MCRHTPHKMLTSPHSLSNTPRKQKSSRPKWMMKYNYYYSQLPVTRKKLEALLKGGGNSFWSVLLVFPNYGKLTVLSYPRRRLVLEYLSTKHFNPKHVFIVIYFYSIFFLSWEEIFLQNFVDCRWNYLTFLPTFSLTHTHKNIKCCKVSIKWMLGSPQSEQHARSKNSRSWKLIMNHFFCWPKIGERKRLLAKRIGNCDLKKPLLLLNTPKSFHNLSKSKCKIIIDWIQIEPRSKTFFCLFRFKQNYY